MRRLRLGSYLGVCDSCDTHFAGLDLRETGQSSREVGECAICVRYRHLSYGMRSIISIHNGIDRKADTGPFVLIF